jgi:ABC-type glycerol-3-phosphate transport system substrate-binding protein
MIKIQKSFCLVLVLMFSFTLTACRTKEPVAKDKTYEGVELTYYKMFDDSEVFDGIVLDYQASHPGLQIHYKQFTDFQEYQRVILNEMAEGEGPDIFSMQNTWFASNHKKISPLPYDKGSPDDFEGLFVDVAAQDLVLTNSIGERQVYGLPLTVDTLALYYNKNHFEDKIPTRGQPSDTWQGIKEDVVKLNKYDEDFSSLLEVGGIAMGRSDNISRAVDIYYLLLLQHGTDFYNENMSQATFAGQHLGALAFPGLEALDLFTGFADSDNLHFSWSEYLVDDDSEEKEVEAFAKGRVSMFVGFSYSYDDIVNQINLLKADGENGIDEDDIRIAFIPQLEDPDVSTDKRVTYANYFAETVSRNSQNPDLAWDFLIELTKKENLEHYFDKTNKPTSRRDMIEDQKKHPIYGVFASQIGFAESFPIIDYYTYRDIFSIVINNANLAGIEKSNLLDAQNAVSAMLPEGGLLIPVATSDVNTEEEGN